MDLKRFAQTPEPPYYAVIFASQQTGNPEGYDAMGDAMVQLAATQPGFLGIESTRDETGFGITVSYWTAEVAIAQWKQVAAHRVAQERGHADWYAHFELRVARVERAYSQTNSPKLGLRP